MLKHILGGLKRKERNEEHINELHRLNRVIADLKGENARLKGQLDAAKAAHRRSEAAAVKAEAVLTAVPKKAAGDVAPKTRIRRRIDTAKRSGPILTENDNALEPKTTTTTKRVRRTPRKKTTAAKKK